MLDCLIIGGSAAGLTAGVYLARFERKVVVLDAGASRLRRIPLARNVPGFAAGISGDALLERLKLQAQSYGCRLIADFATNIERVSDGFEIRAHETQWRARTILMAIGVKPQDPDIADLDSVIARGLVRYCPICDGFEVRDRKIAVLAAKPSALEEARFLRTYSRDVTYIPAAPEALLSADAWAAATAEGIKVVTRLPLRLDAAGTQMLVRFADEEEAFDALYPCLGAGPVDALKRISGVALSEEGAVLVDAHQRTNVQAIYAAGDVVKGLDQIAVAFGQGALAATTIHNDLRAGLSGESNTQPCAQTNPSNVDEMHAVKQP